jgi:hypothetical protein
MITPNRPEAEARSFLEPSPRGDQRERQRGIELIIV